MKNTQIFAAVKDYVTAADVAQRYGLSLNRNKMCSCPFHKNGQEKHPSMKVDKGYKCFACGEGGDAISLAAKLTGLSQYDAAVLIVKDFGLPIETEVNKDRIQAVRKEYKKKMEEKALRKEKEKLLQKIVNHNVDVVRTTKKHCDFIIEYAFLHDDDTLSDAECKLAGMVGSSCEEWLDILCLLGEDEKEKRLKDRNELLKDINVAKKCEKIKQIFERLTAAGKEVDGHGEAAHLAG